MTTYPVRGRVRLLAGVNLLGNDELALVVVAAMLAVGLLIGGFGGWLGVHLYLLLR